jgi:hypothetical protein
VILTVNRELSRNGFTPGELLWDKAHEAWTCEDEIREVKIQDRTAIPPGTYDVVIDYSPHFLQLMPHILNVPGFTGIRIHTGNTALDTSGCLLIGDTRTDTGIGLSRAEYDEFFPKLQEALAKGRVQITFHNPPLTPASKKKKKGLIT